MYSNIGGIATYPEMIQNEISFSKLNIIYNDHQNEQKFRDKRFGILFFFLISFIYTDKYNLPHGQFSWIIIHKSFLKLFHCVVNKQVIYRKEIQVIKVYRYLTQMKSIFNYNRLITP